jgi:hypothetical protein
MIEYENKLSAIINRENFIFMSDTNSQKEFGNYLIMQTRLIIYSVTESMNCLGPFGIFGSNIRIILPAMGEILFYEL